MVCGLKKIMTLFPHEKIFIRHCPQDSVNKTVSPGSDAGFIRQAP